MGQGLLDDESPAKSLLLGAKRLDKRADYIKYASEVATRLEVPEKSKNSIAFFAELFEQVREDFKAQ